MNHDRRQRPEGVEQFGAQSERFGRRESVRCRVELDVGIGGEQHFYNGLSESLSVGGVFVATHRLRPVGEHLNISLFLPGRPEPINCSAEVRWVRHHDPDTGTPPGFGLRFVAMAADDLAALGAFVLECKLTGR